MGHHASLVAVTSACAHTFCRQPESQVEPIKSVHANRAEWTVTYQTSIFDRVIPQKRSVREAAPPGSISSLSALSVALRI